MNPLIFIESLGLSAIWSTALLVPYVLSASDPIMLALGRYFVYGLISLTLYFGSRQKFSLTRAQWKAANAYSLAGNIGYYATMALGVRYAGMTVAAMIIGILPLSIMAFGNLKNREIAFSRLALPALLILIGIVGINFKTVGQLPSDKTILEFALGILFSFISLVCWTWYSVANASWLTMNPQVSDGNWTTAIGMCSLWQSAALLPLIPIATGGSFSETFRNSDPLLTILLALLYLGIVNTWITTMWWNRISRRIPLSLAGQLLVFATIASIAYGHIVDKTFPENSEILFVAIQILGVGLGIYRFSKKQSI